jgi:hypothetical protein
MSTTAESAAAAVAMMKAMRKNNNNTPPEGGEGGEDREVAIGQDFKVSEGALPCDAGVGARLGGIKPYLGLKPVLFNLQASFTQQQKQQANRAKSQSSSLPNKSCGPVVTSATRMRMSLEASQGDEAYCLLRALLEPSPRLVKTLEGILGKAALEAKRALASSSTTQASILRSINGGGYGGGVWGRSIPPSATAATTAAAAASAAASSSVSLVPGHVPVVGVHLRLQEAISTEHDVNWGLRCAALVAGQLARKGNGGKGSEVSSVWMIKRGWGSGGGEAGCCSRKG